MPIFSIRDEEPEDEFDLQEICDERTNERTNERTENLRYFRPRRPIFSFFENRNNVTKSANFHIVGGNIFETLKNM